ncbi:glycosyltransferase [Dyadobacter subterraneus]|uniref:Glycosyltransferase n=1 Tax=Dyadobacter subterraneus TaxID=2773304 RepID=A0ABR9WIU2_9BACT|nr:glycosyltransferase [Dyadobacter subterraneus]MBE9465024.1 glycosyltransferase [Dyadobacter subterraneus]
MDILKKRISFLNVDLTSGGCEREISNLAHHFKEKFHILVVLFYNEISYKLPSETKFKFLDKGRRDSDFIKLLQIPILAYKYAKHCKSENIDVSISYVYRANYVNLLSKILFGNRAKIIVNEQNHTLTQYPDTSLNSSINRFLIKILYKYADVIRPNSKLIANDLIKYFDIPEQLITPIYNPLAVDFINSQLKKDISFSYYGFNFITVARLHHQKNPELLIKAFHIAFKDINNVNLLILGEGPLKEEILTLIKNLGLETRVYLLGFINNPFAFLERCDSFVLSSNYEGFPNSLLEALACGLPSVSTDCPSGPREMLAPSTDFTKMLTNTIEEAEFGILVPTNNVKLLSVAMLNIYNNTKLRNNYKSKSKLRALDFDISVFDKEFQDLL